MIFSSTFKTLAKSKNNGFTKEQFADDRLYSFKEYSEQKKKYGNAVLSYYYGERFGFWGAENKEVYNDYDGEEDEKLLKNMMLLFNKLYLDGYSKEEYLQFLNQLHQKELIQTSNQEI